LPFVIVLMIGIAAYIALSNLKKPPETVDRLRPAPLVETAEVQLSSENLQLDTDGEVVPYRHISLAAQVAGRIVFKATESRAGSFVRQGTRLLQIDPRDYDLAIESIQEQLKQIEVQIEELDVERSNGEKLLELAREDVTLQKREVARAESLIEQRASSQSILDTARRAQIQAANAAQTLENQLQLIDTRRGRFLSNKDQLLVELRRAQIDRERCDITAPMDGVITEDLVEEDDFVQPGATLFRLEDTGRVEVRFDLRLDQLRWIWEGAGRGFNPVATDDPLANAQLSYELPQLPILVAINVDGYRYVWDATLSRYDGAGLNPATRTVPCIAVVENPRSGRWLPGQLVPPGLAGPPALMRGMFVAVHVDVPASQKLLKLPLVALRPDNVVWRVAGDQLEVSRVKVAQATETHVLVFSNLSDVQSGDRVIVTPLALALNGMEVRAQPTTINVSEVSSKPTDGINGSHGNEPAGLEEVSR
jgi:multidrug efflux pump subunit AcrA (membrane-fusion protein)